MAAYSGTVKGGLESELIALWGAVFWQEQALPARLQIDQCSFELTVVKM